MVVYEAVSYKVMCQNRTISWEKDTIKESLKEGKRHHRAEGAHQGIAIFENGLVTVAVSALQC